MNYTYLFLNKTINKSKINNQNFKEILFVNKVRKKASTLVNTTKNLLKVLLNKFLFHKNFACLFNLYNFVSLSQV